MCSRSNITEGKTLCHCSENKAQCKCGCTCPAGTALPFCQDETEVVRFVTRHKLYRNFWSCSTRHQTLHNKISFSPWQSDVCMKQEKCALCVLRMGGGSKCDGCKAEILSDIATVQLQSEQSMYTYVYHKFSSGRRFTIP